jgi:hypothetical protein
VRVLILLGVFGLLLSGIIGMIFFKIVLPQLVALSMTLTGFVLLFGIIYFSVQAFVRRNG